MWPLSVPHVTPSPQRRYEFWRETAVVAEVPATHLLVKVRHGLQARCKQPEGGQMVPASGS
jgi:hypothetical protein